MNARLLEVLSLSARKPSEDLISFVSSALKAMTPSSKGWKERAIPPLAQQWKENKRKEERAEFAAFQEEWLNSEHYAEKSAEARKVEHSSTLPLEVGQSLIYRGCQLATRLTPHVYISRERLYSHHVTDAGHWIGENYFSHSLRSESDRYFIPEGMKIEVSLLHIGCPITFQVCRVTRTA